MLGFYVPPTAKVIQRPGLRLKSHTKDCFSNVFGKFDSAICYLDIAKDVTYCTALQAIYLHNLHGQSNVNVGQHKFSG